MGSIIDKVGKVRYSYNTIERYKVYLYNIMAPYISTSQVSIRSLHEEGMYRLQCRTRWVRVWFGAGDACQAPADEGFIDDWFRRARGGAAWVEGVCEQCELR